MRAVIAAIAALGLSACVAVRPDPVTGVLPSDLGGGVDATLAAIEAHTGPVIIRNHNVSAGTYWLRHPEACLEPTATQIYHQPSLLGIIPWSQDWLDRYMHPQVIESYRGAHRDWYLERYSVAGFAGVYHLRGLTAAQIVAMGGGEWCSWVPQVYR